MFALKAGRLRSDHVHLALHSATPPLDADGVAGVDVSSFIRELRRSKREVEIARQQFDTVDDPMLIDHIVFRLGAAEKRLNYLFQLARKLDIAADGMRWEWYEQD
ncbi:MAG: YaaL family protein [Alicyclobacillus sp.]|nr:YaaL family protein [Alicyclobacillus sp.]